MFAINFGLSPPRLFASSPPRLVAHLAGALIVSLLAAARADDWRYVQPQAGAEHEYPPLRAIPLAADKPDDLTEKAEYRGTSRRYAQLRYGSPAAARVAVVLDYASPTDADLYVDVDRNRTIEAKERIAGEERFWRVPLNVEYVQGEVTKRQPRELVFRLGTTGRTLSFAAAGYLEGRVALARNASDESSSTPPAGAESGGLATAETFAARRMDGDGNGHFTDPQDRLWLDLNADGRWDAVEEQFLFSTILTIGGTRYAVRSDEQGRQLALQPLEGTGLIKLAIRQKLTEAERQSAEPGVHGRIAEVAVTLVGRDGSAVGLRGVDAEAAVPVGDYRVSAVTVALDDLGGGQRWNFVFSDNQGRDAKTWYTLAKDARLELAPLAKLDFLTGLAQPPRCRPGDDLTVQPQLFTGDGLLINTCYRGTHDSGRSGVSGRIALTGSDGSLLAAAQSGFA